MNSAAAGLHVALACDEAYAMPLATTLRSLAEAHRGGPPPHAHVLTDGLSKRTRERVVASLPAGAACVHWHDIELAAYSGFSTLAGISRMTFARLLLPAVLPPDLPRVLYLDTDVLVLKPLTELWHTDLGDAVVGAVVDGMDGQIKAGAPHLATVPRVARYFNAGVLLIDLARWRGRGVTARARDHLHRHPRTPFADQDALNVACDGDWFEIDRRWNGQDHLSTDMAALDAGHRPAILHFVTSRKPWRAESLNPNRAFYDGFRARTAYARSPADKARDAWLRQWTLVKQWAMRHAAVRRLREAQRRRAHA